MPGWFAGGCGRGLCEKEIMMTGFVGELFGFLRPALVALLLGLGFVLAPGAVVAADNGIFLGVAAGDVSSDYDWGLGPQAIGAAQEDRGFKLIGGVRPIDALAVEVDYVDFGATAVPIFVACPAVVGFPCPDRASIDTRALQVSVVGLLALPLLDVFGRVGVSRWESDRTVRFTSSRTEEGTDPTFGVGAQVRVGSFALRVEYERFERPSGSVDIASLGFTYTFL